MDGALVKLDRTTYAEAIRAGFHYLLSRHDDVFETGGALYESAGKLDAARRHYETALERRPGDPRLLAHRRRVLEALERRVPSDGKR